VMENPDDYIMELNRHFEREKVKTYITVRIYAILYSHLEMNIKTQLMKNCYTVTKDTGLIYVARRMGNVEFLEWMMRNY